MNLELDHLSYSSISSYMTCGKAWKYRYIDKVQTPASPVLVTGSCVHETVEEIIRRRTLSIEDINPVEYAKADFDRRKTELAEEDAENAEKEIVNMVSAPAILSGISELRAALDHDGQPLIEKKVELRIPEVELPIIGYIDIILSDGTPADFKTAARSWTQERAESEKQPIFYLAAMGQCGIPVNWKFRHLVMVKTLKPKFQILEHEHKPAELFGLFKQVQDVWRSIEKGVFLPAAPGSWKCSPKWCEYWDICQGNEP